MNATTNLNIATTIFDLKRSVVADVTGLPRQANTPAYRVAVRAEQRREERRRELASLLTAPFTWRQLLLETVMLGLLLAPLPSLVYITCLLDSYQQTN